MTPKSFFERTELSPQCAEKITSDALHGAEDGELFLEYKQSEALSFDDGKVKTSTFDVSQGFGLRGVVGEKTTYAHSSEISEEALLRAAETVQGMRKEGNFSIPPQRTNKRFYSDENPIEQMAFGDKVSLLGAIDLYIRSKDPKVKQVSVDLRANWQVVQILRPDGYVAQDVRPLAMLIIVVAVEDKGRLEVGRSIYGHRGQYEKLISEDSWKTQADDALRKALLGLVAESAPAGEMPVVLGNGTPAVLLHEAVGHGLEGDFNRKGSSTFSDSMGERIASPGVTVIDAGNVTGHEWAQGNLTIDDEGTPSSSNILIEDGIMTGHMNDRMNARLLGEKPTGNGRRQSYAHQPLPRMTNTYMLPGKHTQEEMIASVEKGLFATDFGGGQVDITSGKFVFTTAEAYLIENGKVTTPVKNATLIGSGPEAMQKISMIGDDLCLDHGVGMCGKGGQSVLVGFGQPSLLISQMTVGGTS